MIDPSWVAGLAAILFGIGLIGTFSRKNGIVVLMCIELMLNAANLNFVAGALNSGGVEGWEPTFVELLVDKVCVEPLSLTPQVRPRRLDSITAASSRSRTEQTCSSVLSA